MKLYYTDSYKADTMLPVGRWAGTQADATKVRKEFKAAGNKVVETTEVEVPTNKADLIAFLNGANVCPADRKAIHDKE